MHATPDGRLLLSATDLSDFLGCPHLPLLWRAAAKGGPKPPKYDDPSLEVLRRRGLEHERGCLASLTARAGGAASEIPAPDPSLPLEERWRIHHDRTVEALQAGAAVVYQGALFDGTWFGRPDFLVRVEEPSALGAWSYEVEDAKLARDAKGGALLQLLLYADLLSGVQGGDPVHVRLALGGPEPRTETFRVADYAATFRSIRARLLWWLREGPAEPPFAPEPVELCEVCAWRARCEAERSEADHLSLVAGARRSQRRALEARGVGTMESLASLKLPLAQPLDGVSDATLDRIHRQARIQVEARRTGEMRYELLPVVEGDGLTRLPEPSPGDLFFDIEADPYALTEGLEYLFGFADRDDQYVGWWALDRRQERLVFQRFIDSIMKRLDTHPDLHVYHFAHYEPTALKRLMGRHGTREDEVDRLLRGGVLVDPHQVVRQAVRASVQSYSIKELERLYAFDRAVGLRAARHALAHFEAWLELGGTTEERDALLTHIEGYNRDDCLSTRRLRDWLESRREELADATGSEVPRPILRTPDPNESLEERRADVARRMEILLEGLEEGETPRNQEARGRWLLAQLLEFHRREDKSAWWEYFRCRDLGRDEWEEDRAVLGPLEYEGVVGTVKRSLVHRYRFPPQGHGVEVGKAVKDVETEGSPGTVLALDDARGTIDLARRKGSETPNPRALVPFDLVKTDVLRESLLGVADAVILHGFTARNPLRAAVDLLLRRPPRAAQQPGAGLVLPGEETLAAAKRQTLALDATVLPVQGPPGSGKTYTGARMIVEAIRAGKCVGVTATSHKVISNLLEVVCEAGVEESVAIRGIQKADAEQRSARKEIEATGSNAAVLRALEEGDVNLAAGTAWLWSRREMIGSVDVLFIDEAGQFSLANALAVAPAGNSMVLLGDPQQLQQPTQGVHPPGTGDSALDHLLDEAATLSGERGLFLLQTWRLHPRVCQFTSEVFYDERLMPRPGLENQRVQGPGPLVGSGLRYVPVEHLGNGSESAEEVEEVVRLVHTFVEDGWTWTDPDGKRHPVGLREVLVVAPYNAQVSAIADRLPAAARVGTVDKFQGQEAPIVLYSMASSSADEAPRGMGFLYSPNRLNVATSRARCLAIIVASPALFAPPCRTPEQMRLSNGFCRFRELAEG